MKEHEYRTFKDFLVITENKMVSNYSDFNSEIEIIDFCKKIMNQYKELKLKEMNNTGKHTTLDYEDKSGLIWSLTIYPQEIIVWEPEFRKTGKYQAEMLSLEVFNPNDLTKFKTWRKIAKAGSYKKIINIMEKKKLEQYIDKLIKQCKKQLL